MADGRDLGTIINERRLALGYSLGQLANRVGTTASKVRSWERGAATPDEETVARLAAELNLDAGDLKAALPSPPAAKAAPEEEDDDATAAVAAPVFSDAGDTMAAAVDDESTPPPASASSGESQPEPAPELEPEPVKAQDPAVPESQADPVEDPADHAAAADTTADPRRQAEEPTAVVAAFDPVEDVDAGDAGEAQAADLDEPEAETRAAEPAAAPRMADLPTEAVPVIVAAGAAPAGVGTALAAPPPPARSPAPVAAATAMAAPNGGFLAPVEQFFNTVFDPKKRYLFWIRTALTVIVFLVFLRVLAWAVPAFFDALKQILDTIESTPAEVEPGTVIEGLTG